MTAVIARHGSFAIKIFPGHSAEAIEAAVKRAEVLRRFGVRTPGAVPSYEDNGIKLHWIEGLTMKAAYEDLGPMTAPAGVPAFHALMGAAMSMLSNLHAAGAPQLNLPKFDPFRHIDKRLAGHDSLIIAPGLRGIASALRRELDSGQPPSTGPCVTHGDFHCGQMIMDSVSGDWWLIDLDDMALGYPESDIANFCAHLATSRSISALGALDFYNAAVEAALGSYSRPVNRGRLNFFAAAAFLRRALKLAQRGCPEELALSVISAARRIFPT